MDDDFKRVNSASRSFTFIFLIASIVIFSRLSLLYSLHVEIGDKTLMLMSSSDEKVRYANFAEVMSTWGYAWEPIEVVTDDGYILTIFHVKGKLGHPQPKL